MKKIKYTHTDDVVFYEKLKNGLEVFMYPSDKAKSFYITYSVKFGSIHTKFKVDGGKPTVIPYGTAHFLEHQMFQMEDGDAFSKFASLGSNANAFTTYNDTTYEVMSNSNFKENLELLIDVVNNPYFQKSSVDNERGIISEEIKMYDDNPSARSAYGLEYNININDNHKYLISGTIDDINKINKDILYKTYDTFYRSDNMFIIITGKFKPLEALGIIKERMKKYPNKDNHVVDVICEKEPVKVFKSMEEVKMDVALPKIRLAYKMPRKSFKDFDDLMLKIYLRLILNINFGITSDLLENMINQRLINYDIYAKSEVRKDYIYISFTLESEYKDEVIELIKETLRSMKISKEDMDRYKKVWLSNYIMHFDDIIEVNEDILDDVLNSGKINDNVIDIINDLNVEDVTKIIDAFTLDNECLYIINKDN